MKVGLVLMMISRQQSSHGEYTGRGRRRGRQARVDVELWKEVDRATALGSAFSVYVDAQRYRRHCGRRARPVIIFPASLRLLKAQRVSTTASNSDCRSGPPATNISPPAAR
jgi:hypothetical protein